MKKDVEVFLEYLAAKKDYSQNTVTAYRNDLSQLMAYIEVERAKGVIRSNGELLKSYLLNLREKRYSLATTARKIASAKSFLNLWLIRES
jgi:Site-specific recombinase XerD